MGAYVGLVTVPDVLPYGTASWSSACVSVADIVKADRINNDRTNADTSKMLNRHR
ncbi:MAG: hypothetical protein IJW00_05365 [Clostridia bacterium]|nr:hypothetical protein [Clostridia bacterium]